jgi:hypothetical protein
MAERDDTKEGTKEDSKRDSTRDDVDQARRKLLRSMVYVAPVVMSAVVVQPAYAQALSCGPSSCHPRGGDCGPAGCPPAGGTCGPSSCQPRS